MELTLSEKTKLAELEAIIKDGLMTFIDVGACLWEIRNSRLYRAEYGTFEQYCREKWQMTRAYAGSLIKAHEIVTNIENVNHGLQTPATERQVRPLAKLAPEDQKTAWQKAVETAPEGKVTAKHVEKVVAEMKQETKADAAFIESTGKENPVFNRTNENIEWAQWTWNPVTGCEHGCPYCYARDIAIRFTGHFKPEFHFNRLSAPKNTTVPKSGDAGCRNVFVCSMADLFGEWVPEQWIAEVLKSVKRSPAWNFIFLTKNPRRYLGITFPDNCWLGATADTQKRADHAVSVFHEMHAMQKNKNIKFISCEPLLEPVEISFAGIDWLIIGGRSASSKCPEFQPEWGWVNGLLRQADRAGCRVYWKPNLTVRPREYPEHKIYGGDEHEESPIHKA